MLMIRSGLGSLGASLVFWLYGDPYSPLLVEERGWVDRNLGRIAFAVELAKGPAEAFTPLKAVLESISGVYAQYQVHFDALPNATL